MSAIAIAWWPGFAGTRMARAMSARCCWACSTIRARCSTSACAPALPQEKRRELAEFLAPYRRDALVNHPWRAWAEPARSGAAHAGRTEPMEPGQGSFLGAAAAGAGGGGGLRAHAGQPLPPHGAVSEMAHRQAARGLHLRAARSGSAARADGDFFYQRKSR